MTRADTPEEALIARPRIDRSGHRFGSLVAIEVIRIDGRRQPYWRCLCDCGAETSVRADRLANGRTRSCGCTKGERIAKSVTTHGLSRHPAYKTWEGMLARCYKPENQNYRWYGGRGVRVCDEWRETPTEFCAWMDAQGWRLGLQVDRIDPDGDYGPDNCRIVTKRENVSRARRRGAVLPLLSGSAPTISQTDET